MGKKARQRQRQQSQRDSDQVVVVPWKGEHFRVREPAGMQLLLFAAHGRDMDPNDLGALAEVYDLLQDMVVPDEWERFVKHSLKSRASIDDMGEMFRLSMEALTARPTSRPSDSSDGPQSTRESSTGDSSSRVIQRQLDKGRPDLAMAVHLAQEDQKAAALRAV